MSAPLSAMVIKSTTAHIFHVGDSRIYRARRQYAGATHRRSPGHHFVRTELSGPRAGDQSPDRNRLPGASRSKRATFSCWRPTASTSMSAPASSPRRSTTMRRIWTRRRGSSSRRPTGTAARTISRSRSSASTKCRTAKPARFSAPSSELPLPPLLEARMMFDGYRIVRELHGSSRSHIYLAVDTETDALVAIKIPSIDLRDDPAYLKRFMMEEWVARRIDSPHVLKPLLAVQKAQLPLCRDGIHRRADPDAMDDRQSEAGPGNGARHRRADRQGPARLSPQGDAASGSAARQHHDRQDRNGEDHRFRLDQNRRRRRGGAPPATTTFWAPCNTPRRNIFAAKAARRAPTCSRSASSPIRC